MNKPNGISDKVWEVANDPKPYGVGAGRLWLEGHLTKLDPKIGEPYASQVVAEIDSYIDRLIAIAISKAIEGDRKETLAELAEEAGEYLSNDPELLGFSAAMETLRNRSKGEE